MEKKKILVKNHVLNNSDYTIYCYNGFISLLVIISPTMPNLEINFITDMHV